MKTPHPSPLELQVLSVLWARGESTVRDVLDHFPDGRSRAYTTALSVLQTMERKGLVSRKTTQKAHIYRARRSEKQITGPMIRDLVQNVFNGDPVALIAAVLESAPVPKDELANLADTLRGKTDVIPAPKRGSEKPKRGKALATQK